VTEPSFPARFTQLATAHGHRPALTFGDTTLSFDELQERATTLAHHLDTLGVGLDDFVTVGEPNSIEFVVTCVAAWQVGAIPQPVSSQLPRHELDTVIALADPALVVGVEVDDRPFLPRGFRPPPTPAGVDALDDRIASAWKAPMSGGSTGRPKLIVSGDPAAWSEPLGAMATILGARDNNTMIMPGPLYHNGPFVWTFYSLLAGSHVVLLPRFDAEATLRAIEDHGGEAMYLVPTMMQRIWKLPEDLRLGYDVSSLKVAFHLAEPCPQWLKRAWIDWLGPDVIWELYAGTEGQAITVLDGHDWLAHPGSVGRLISGEIRICDHDGNDLPAGEVGEIFMRSVGRDTPTYRYVGAETRSLDGWESLGDMGSMDEDGFVYLSDRRTDMILVGGANVYPAEVEAALNEHPAVRSAGVIGLPDADKGNRIHAIVEADADIEDDLGAFLAGRLVRYKLPRTYEFVAVPLRDDAGKVRRSALRAERLEPDAATS
jgi:bile acid-coenzyme A ligase